MPEVEGYGGLERGNTVGRMVDQDYADGDDVGPQLETSLRL